MKNKLAKGLNKKYSVFKKNKKLHKRLEISLGIIFALGLLYYFKSLFIVAVVDGKPITRFSLIKQLESDSGKQTLDNLITKTLIFEQAQKNNIEIPKEEVDKEIDNLKTMLEDQGTTLDAALAYQGQTLETLQENIRIQKTLEKLLESEITISEEEMQNYFEENKSYYGEGANYEDLKNDISSSLKEEKLSNAFNDWMTKLRSDSNIKYFVDYQ